MNSIKPHSYYTVFGNPLKCLTIERFKMNEFMLSSCRCKSFVTIQTIWQLFERFLRLNNEKKDTHRKRKDYGFPKQPQNANCFML